MNLFKSMNVKATTSLLLLATIAVSIFGCSSAAAQDTEFEAVVSTGLNRSLGQPIFEFPFMPSPYKENWGFKMLGVALFRTPTLRHAVSWSSPTLPPRGDDGILFLLGG